MINRETYPRPVRPVQEGAVDHHPIHLHSMLVHAVVALAPLAAAAYLLEAGSVAVAGIGPEVWALLLRGSLVAMLVLAFPSALTGVSERNHMYVNWPMSHRVKLAASIALVVLVIAELGAIGAGQGAVKLASPIAVAVVIGNNLAVAVLAVYGLRITLGRCSLAGTSYTPDVDRDPAVDILETVAASAAEPAKLIEVRGEGR